MRASVLLLALHLPSALGARPAGLCLPRTSVTRGWPVCAIHMHGLFGSPAYPASKWEHEFRKSLEAAGKTKRCRVAMLFGNVAPSGNQNWNSISLAEVRRRAEIASASSRVVAKPAVIGFSNGADVLRRQSCGALARFAKVTLDGPSGVAGNARVRECGSVTIVQPHRVPNARVLANALPAGSPPLPPPRLPRRQPKGSDPSGETPAGR